MKTIFYTAPAKIHFMGEHSVVHGKPALLVTIDKSLTTTITSSSKKSDFIKNKEFPNFLKFQEVIEDTIKKEYKLEKIPHYSATIHSTIPVGSGLGSSAALSATFTASLLTFLAIKFDNSVLYKIAYEGEKFFHGNPSGGDLAAVIEGGLLYFRKEFEFLKNFSRLPFSTSGDMNNFFIINSGKPSETTLDMVKKVGELKNKFPDKINRLFDDQELQTKNLVLALRDDNEDLLKKSIKNGEENLEKLEIVGNTAKKIVRGIEEIGGVAKISGAGGTKKGSGIILGYHTDFKKVSLFCKQNKLEFERIKIVNLGIQKS